MCLSVIVVHLLMILLTQTKHCACIYADLPQVLVSMPTSHVLRTLVRLRAWTMGVEFTVFDRLCSRAAPLYSHACIVKTTTPIDCAASGLCQCHVHMCLHVALSGGARTFCLESCCSWYSWQAPFDLQWDATAPLLASSLAALLA
jgi:hypothetical protein